MRAEAAREAPVSVLPAPGLPVSELPVSALPAQVLPVSGLPVPVLLFGGTTEGRELAQALIGRGVRTILCVATEYGREVLGEGLLENPNLEVRVRRMDAGEIAELIRRECPALVIDATHPYADQVTHNVREACERTGVLRLRCLRPRCEGTRVGEQENAAAGSTIRFASAGEAARWLAKRDGKVLVTTGSKELEEFLILEEFEQRVYARVLPTVPSLEACLKLGLSGRHIIAMQGPFSEDTNRSQLEEFGCRYLVTKDTGDNGGFGEKLRAAEAFGAVALVIERPEAESGMTVEQILERVDQWRRSDNG